MPVVMILRAGDANPTKTTDEGRCEEVESVRLKVQLPVDTLTVRAVKSLMACSRYRQC